jgi:peptidyl-prolyl cis-trans isomerase B (cyclophilin B)
MSNPQVELHIAGKGVILIELDAEKAPLSVENFLHYVNRVTMTTPFFTV